MKPQPTEADEPHNCPHCNVSLLDEPIPEDSKQHYHGNYFKREIGWYDIDIDRTTHFICPDCGEKI